MSMTIELEKILASRITKAVNVAVDKIAMVEDCHRPAGRPPGAKVTLVNGDKMRVAQSRSEVLRRMGCVHRFDDVRS